MPPPGYAPQGSQAGQLAGFGVRLGQYLIDGLLMIIPVIILFVIAAAISGVDNTTGSRVIGSVLVAAAIFAYEYFTIQMLGGTLGMQALGLKVVREEDGGPLPPDRLAIRSGFFIASTVVGIISQVLSALVGLAVLVAFLAVLWEPRKQGYHDKLAKALVIRTK
jgi:uncharacterized RDD family membrane protein YckC